MTRPILVVDDESPTREALATLLRLNGHAVVTASNGREALDRLRETEPCVILLDYVMPIMDGRAFREVQKADPRWAHIPVVLLTAHPVDHFDALAILQKPVTYEILAPLLRACGELSRGSR
jgi:CheY-like chemotaxis protein